MPITTIQRQMRELGRIRTGMTIVGEHGKTRPQRLSTFRLTSPTRSLIEAAAEIYGGVVTPWDQQWEVVTGASSLDIVVPRLMPASTWFELWKAGGCVRRCDGETNTIDLTPCACPADPAQRVALAKRGEACKATTRVAVILPRIPDLGVWRLESHSYYAAVELAGVADLLAAASESGRVIPARLRIEERFVKRPGEGRQAYNVPVIELAEGMTMADLGLTDAPLLGPGERRVPQLPSTAVPATTDFHGPEIVDEADGLPAGISGEALERGIIELGIPLAEARLIALDAYGPGLLTPVQRAEFLERLKVRAAR